jgi:hypothetical protein
LRQSMVSVRGDLVVADEQHPSACQEIVQTTAMD